MNCPYCNENMGQNVNTNFCPKCGHKLIRCAACGEILYKKIKFCPKDGTPVPEELMQELPEGAMLMGAAKAASMKQGQSGRPVNRQGSQYRSSNQNPSQNRSANQNAPQNRSANQRSTQYKSTNQNTAQNRPAYQNVPPKREANAGPAPVRPSGSGTNKGPGQNDGFKKGLLFGLIALLLVALGTGGYLVADKLMSNSSEKTKTESADKEKDKDDEKEDQKKDKEDSEDADDPSDKDASKDSSDKKTDDEEDAVTFNGDEEDTKKTESSDKKKSTDSDKDSDSSGVAYKPEKKDTSKIKASVSLADSSFYSGMTKAKISNSSSSSVVPDNNPGIKNEAAQMVDGNEITSWQEGAPGDGIGEWAQFILKKEYNVRYITFKMGNWRDQERYYLNNRPKGVLLRMGGEEYKLTFPDGMNEYMVELSDALPISDLYLEITSVYKGNSWDDTCISEMTIYAD